MTVMEFFGCTFIAFGPPFALFYFTIAPDPVRIIILIASAFFWLLSLLLSSLWWTIVIPLKDTLEFALVFSVIFQEIFRYLIYLILRKAEGGLKKVTDANTTLVDNKHILAYVAGLGFGIMSGAFALINVLADAAGPGTVGLRGGGDSPLFFVTSALTTLCFILLHTSWSVTFFDALDKKNYFLILTVVVSHFASSFLTLLNRNHLYWASIPAIYTILVISAWLALRSAGAKFSQSELFQRRPLTLQVTD